MNGPKNLLFSELGLPEPILEGIRRAGFQACTPIQSQSLPLALEGKDIAGQAQTGTGKTAAFLIATFNRLLRHAPPDADRLDGPRAVILAPTRELAVQIHADALVLGAATGLRIAVVFGGTDYDKQRDQLAAGVDVLIGTPGRLIDFFKQHIFSLRHVQVMVLDEADRMFDLGFIKDIRFVLRRLPPFDRRLNLLFSATLSYRVLELAYEHMNNPHLVQIEPDKKTVDKVTQVVYFPANPEKPGLLIAIMKRMQASRTMVFVNTKREADHVADILNANGIGAAAISGDVPQPKRLKMLKNFQEGSLPVLVATDVASRGLHVPDVSHVVNYDLPQDPEDYVHRIGRTARAGASGDSVSFACESYAVTLPEIEAYIGHRIPVGQMDPGLLVEVKIPPREGRPRFGGRPGGRGRPGGGGGGSRGRSGGG
ncbi:MAG: RNA helicase, partial [Gammaproteobacteria bacterium]|nr:RNA helicase [Gammaproteobacteria bacterium]